MSGWISRIACSRAEADAVARTDDLLTVDDATTTLVATEAGEGWQLHLYTPERPDDMLLARFAALAMSTATIPVTEPLPDADWVALSQQGLEPVDAGRFHIHTGDHPDRHRPGQWPIRIDAGLAFGTGQHATTHGCLLALQTIAKRHRPSAVLDIGTGTGVLILAAGHLFARARLVATDVDRRATDVAGRNFRLNGVAPGRIGLHTAFGIAHPAIARGGPYPLVVANILAGPLVAMAPSLAPMVQRGGHLVLAGLLAGQRRWLLAVYRARGFRLVSASHGGQWPVLVLRQRRAGSPRAALSRARRGTAAEARRADSI